MSPKTTKRIAKLIAFVLVGALVITSFTFVFSFAESPGLTYGVAQKSPDWDREFSLLKDLIIKTKEGYKDDVPYDLLLKGAYEGVVDALGDPYSVYYSSRDESSEFEESISGEFSGVGISLEKIGDECKVVTPIQGGPSEKAGVLSGDTVFKVDDIDVSGFALTEIVSMLRGEKGTKVKLIVLRGGKEISFLLTRETIKLSSVSYELLANEIGYIKISQFDSDSHLEFKDARLKLTADGAKSFILDIRNNPGGYVGTATGIAEQMMPKGPIVHFQNQDKIVETIHADGRGDLKVPLVVLINEGSASASEILAGALKDSGVAKIVGTQSYGKGVAQQIFPAGGNKVKLSMYYFLTPDKTTINQVGITPDYVVKNLNSLDEKAIKDLYESYSKFAPMSEKNKPQKGDTGLNVFGGQQRLSLLGYGNPISGTMDNGTIEAVKAFQKTMGLFPYGTLDYSTMDRLDSSVLEYIIGAENRKDLQLEYAIKLLN